MREFLTKESFEDTVNGVHRVYVAGRVYKLDETDEILAEAGDTWEGDGKIAFLDEDGNEVPSKKAKSGPKGPGKGRSKK